ncbi:glycoside hydrolase family 3 protein [Lichtheimia corymbifera JMRC:FSU:9682]|uniref:beta-glucosidase n=1 Tax=Lichtheimia corymbifera JMRC:FSU:9682 TaxID=1263082 RepID=A0A068RW66_9FUNG|nr:glycoside hydrolase family 3 protein [Lichtheimia corymbifera JMRC:FSU:9682]
MRFSLSTLSLATLAIFSSPINAAPHAVDELSWDKAYTKARALVDQMTLDQKVGMVTGVGWSAKNCVGNTYPIHDPYFPSLCLQDGPLGIRFSDNTTAGVAGITAAASFDKDLIYKRGQYMGEESYGKGVNFQLGPSVDIYRSPYAGRGWEGFGEDPYLQGVAGSLTAKGIQSQGVIATGKHYILNNQELNRTSSSSHADERALHEIYVWPYARMVEAGIGSMMCSYNRVDGDYACENDHTINQILKGELGFKGLIMSDWSAHHSTVKSALAGLDMSMPGDITFESGTSWWGSNLTQAVKDGQIPEDRVTDMSVRIAAAWYKMRQDEGFPKSTLESFHRNEAPEVVVSDDHAKIVREIGAASVVLLKNEDNILPLNQDISHLAIIGSDAGPNLDGMNSCPDRGCDKGTLAVGWGSGSVDFPYLVTPKEGIEARVDDSVEVSYTGDDYDIDAVSELAKDADVAIVFSNADSGEQYITVDGNEGDRRNLTLWGNGDNLIQAVADSNENTIVVIHAVGPVLMPWIDHPNIKAVVWPGLPGQESGNSLADVLFGDVNPSGRLPYSIAKKEEDYNVRISPDDEINYLEGLHVGYKHFDAQGIEPLFEFGFGLSYTTFEYSNLKVDGDKDRVTATISIRNTGEVDGAEVAQLYLGFPESANEPPKLLRGFEKVFLKAGKQEKVQFELSKTDLSIWQEGEWIVPQGEYKIYVGASSRDIRQSATLSL